MRCLNFGDAGAQNLTATSLHSREEAIDRWGALDALTALEQIADTIGALRVLHGIDGTLLHDSPLGGTRALPFTLPHSAWNLQCVQALDNSNHRTTSTRLG